MRLGFIGWALVTAGVWLSCGVAQATGVTWVERARAEGPIGIEALRIDATVTGLSATVHIEETLLNASDRDVEGTFLFPLPEGAAVTGFTMSVDGEQAPAELLDHEQAATVYERIVSRLRDPGLLELLGRGIYRVRLYPLPAGGRKVVTLEYRVPLEVRGGVGVLRLPLRSAGLLGQPVRDLSVTVRVDAAEEIVEVSSGAYELDVAYPDPRTAEMTLHRAPFVARRDLDVRIQT
ncbi:VIT domain-containing protein, partial [Planctomycetota bacterium]